MKRIVAFGLILAGLFVAPSVVLAGGPATGGSTVLSVPYRGPSVLAVPYRGPSVLAVPNHGQPSVLGVPQRPAYLQHFLHPGHVAPRQPVWIQPQWAWNGWHWVVVPGYWAR
ncbi:MAG TPA: hypothetical protein VK548_22850 [Candidatus Acidoferrum sp.]|nr:hypothetical protein [Candidatus Acidoferrum sp.]